MISHSKQIANKMFLVTEDGRTFIEAAIVHKGNVYKAEFDVVEGSLTKVMTTARNWQVSRRKELELELKRRRNRERHAARVEAETAAELEVMESDAFDKMVIRITHNHNVINAARNDVRGVWARYGPALIDRVLYVPSFQWI